MKYFIKTFGCQQNKADSERVSAAFNNRGMSPALSYKTANYVVVNTCMIRRSAEDRVYGLVINLGKIKDEKIKKNIPYKIIVTGCMVGLAFRDKTGEYLNKLRLRMPQVDEFMPIEEVGFDNAPVRQNNIQAWVPISNGCNNFCTFCIVPFTRGREISRPYDQIMNECQNLKDRGYRMVTLLGQNVNSYGADLILGEKNIQVMRDLDKTYFSTTIDKVQISNQFQIPNKASVGNLNSRLSENGTFGRPRVVRRNEHALGVQNVTSNFVDKIKPVYVKHLGRYRIPTLFPYLLEAVARLGFEKIEFMSSNPWDFSDELIEVIARNKNIGRQIHLPIQSGDTNVLKRMNRWYTREQYLDLVKKLKLKIKNLKLTTDIIVGFCGETDAEFQNTVDLAKNVGFEKVYVSIYSTRPMTSAAKILLDDVPYQTKKRRWQILEDLINKPRLKNHSWSNFSQNERLSEALQ